MRDKKQLAEEYIEYLYGEEKNEQMYAPDVYQSKKDFKAGFELGIPKWIKVEENVPDNDRTVLVRIKDYRRPQENVTEVSLGYYDEYMEWRYQHSHNQINSGHGWHIEEWTEIPQ